MKNFSLVLLSALVIVCLIVPTAGLSKSEVPKGMAKKNPMDFTVIPNPENHGKKVQTEYITSDTSDDLIVAIQQFFGIIQKTPRTIVKANGVIVGIIPVDSKISRTDLHEYCLGFQYGTKNWYVCELRKTKNDLNAGGKV